MSFGAHQSFYIRDGWLFKAMAAIRGDQELGIMPDPAIFTREDVPQLLGIGRNMVRALRFWVQASGLTTESTGKTGKREHKFTNFGELVWLYDRYLEDVGTLWLIHYHLVCQPDCTTWYWFFNHFGQDKFTQPQFFEQLRQWAITVEAGRETISQKMLEKEFFAFVNTYHHGDIGKQNPENLLTCPLVELYLLANEQDNTYRLLSTPIDRIHPLIFLYVLLQEEPGKPRKTSQLNLAQAINEPMSVGRVFNIGPSSTIELLGRLKNHYPEYGADFIRTGGLDIIRFMGTDITPENVLTRYYEERL